MNRIMVIVIFLSLFLCCPLLGESGNLPTDDQTAKLVAAAWKEPLYGIDTTFYDEVTKSGLRQTEGDIRRDLERDVQKEIETGRRKADDLKSNTDYVGLNVKERVKMRKFPHLSRRRIRVSDCCSRSDSVTIVSDDKSDGNTPIEKTWFKFKSEDANFLGTIKTEANIPWEQSFVRRKNVSGGYQEAWQMHYLKKVIFGESKGEMRGDTINTLLNLGSLPEGSRLLFKAVLGEAKASSGALPVFVPDQQKIQNAVQGKLGSYKLTVTTEGKRDKIELHENDANNPMKVGVVITCDKDDYSKIYRHESLINGKTVFATECDNYDPSGYPHKAILTTYNEKGQVDKKEIYTILDVKINPVFSDDVFSFNIPAGYTVNDNRQNK